MLRDNRTDTISYGRPFLPLVAPVACAAPTTGGAVNVPPGGNIGGQSSYDMTLNSAAFSAEQLAGFGPVLSGGYAATASATAGPSVTNSGQTMEVFFTPTGNPGGLQVLAGSGGLSICHDSNGTLRLGTPDGQFNASTLTVVANHTYHAAAVCGPNGARLYLKDITAGTASSIWVNKPAITGLPYPNAGSFGARCLGSGGGFAYTAGAVFHMAVWDAERWTGTTHTPPATPLTGSDSVKGQ